MGLIILPQALKIVIPGIVNTFIGLFKDTSLVSIIGIFDLLGIVQAGFARPAMGVAADRLDGLCRSRPSSSGSSASACRATRMYHGAAARHRAQALMSARCDHGRTPPASKIRTVCRRTSAIEIIGMNKWYGEFHVLRDINLTVYQRRAHRHLRPVGLGQVDDDPLHQPARGAPEGPDHRRRHRAHQRPQEASTRSAAKSAWCSSTSTCSRISPSSRTARWRRSGCARCRRRRPRSWRCTTSTRVKIPEQAKKYPGQLSGGQQQRVAIARVAVHEPARSCCSTSRPRRSIPR